METPPVCCVVCGEGDESGPIQHCDFCDTAFHVDVCAVDLGLEIDTRRLGDIGPCLACKIHANDERRRSLSLRRTAALPPGGSRPVGTAGR